MPAKETSQERYTRAMNDLKNPDVPLARKLMAHEEILRYGMPGCGDSARQERIAEAISDLCLAVALLMSATKPN